MTSDAQEKFSEDPAPADAAGGPDSPRGEALLVLDLDGYEGPIDLLLTLARDQKVDLREISILALAEQYLEFIDEARKLRLEIAADYLVMAAWLAYLKSRLMVPKDDADEELSGEDMAEALAYQMRRLEAMQDCATRMMGRPRLNWDLFPRGAPEGLPFVTKAIHEVSLYDLLRAYGDIKVRKSSSTYRPEAFNLMSMDEALERLALMLGKVPGEWLSIRMFLPEDLRDALMTRSAMAATFGATLEMAKQGLVDLRQDGEFKPIYLRRREVEKRFETPESATDESDHADDEDEEENKA